MTVFPRLRPVSNLRTSRCTSGTGTVRRGLNDLFRSLGASLPHRTPIAFIGPCKGEKESRSSEEG